jgi:hypothetical protein
LQGEKRERKDGIIADSYFHRNDRKGEPPRIHEFITNYTKRREYFFALISQIGNELYEWRRE